MYVFKCNEDAIPYPAALNYLCAREKTIYESNLLGSFYTPYMDRGMALGHNVEEIYYLIQSACPPIKIKRK